jgi:hypothetical protein
VSGDGLGKDIFADVIATSREVLTGDGYGITILADAICAAREVLTGDGYGVTYTSGIASIVREVLIKEMPIKASAVVRETLASVDDPLSVARVITGYRQSAVMLRPKMALPSAVKSPQIVPTLREHVVMRNLRTWPKSTRFAQTLRMQAALRRVAKPAPQMWSTMRVGTYREQIVQSRGKVYVPVSAVYTRTQRQMVVSHRATTPASQIRTPISVGGQRQVVVLSRRVIVSMTSADVATLVLHAVQKATRVAPYSEVDSAGLVQMTVQRHNVVPPGIDDRVGSLSEQAVIRRAPTTTAPFGVEHSAAISQQAIMARVAPIWRSTADVAGGVMLTIQHRDTYAPQYAMGRNAATLRQQTVMKRDVGPVHGYAIVRQARLSFTLHRDTPKPWEVIDPSIGRHTASLRMLTVQHRVTLPPDVLRTQSRYVFNAASQVVVGDAFPAPEYPAPVHETDVNSVVEFVMMRDSAGWEPVSSVKSTSMSESLVIGDAEGWIDATIPQSDVTTCGIVQHMAVADEFPDSMLPQSDAEVAALVTMVALGDSSLPDPAIPASEVSSLQVAEIAALGDAQFPDPLIPLSELRLRAVGAFCVLGDPSLAGQFGMSEISAPSVAEVVVIPDRSLVGIPLRKGPRPVVTVSMS